jgi:hypothetical protein
MHSKKLAPGGLEYRLDQLDFFGTPPVVMPRGTRMLYEPDDHVILVEFAPGPNCLSTEMRLLSVFGKSEPPPELKRIEYAMLVDRDGAKRTLNFYHPLKRGSGVRLATNGKNWFFRQDDGGALFSKDYTLRDVSRGDIDSDFAVWQFHGYRHEH